jgi:copper chaperone
MSQSSNAATAAVTTEFEVTGMSCGHCVSAVTTEVGAIPNVQDVQVDLPTGKVTVVSNGPVDRTEVAAAVDEAGYVLA